MANLEYAPELWARLTKGDAAADAARILRFRGDALTPEPERFHGAPTYTGASGAVVYITWRSGTLNVRLTAAQEAELDAANLARGGRGRATIRDHWRAWEELDPMRELILDARRLAADALDARGMYERARRLRTAPAVDKRGLIRRRHVDAVCGKVRDAYDLLQWLRVHDSDCVMHLHCLADATLGERRQFGTAANDRRDER